MRFLLIMMIFTFPLMANAMLSSMRVCPQKFIGSVEKIKDEEGAIHSRSVNTVIFHNEETITGEVAQKEEIKVLKFGSIQLEVGGRYVVSLDNHKICQITPEGEED